MKCSKCGHEEEPSVNENVNTVSPKTELFCGYIVLFFFVGVAVYFLVRAETFIGLFPSCLFFIFSYFMFKDIQTFKRKKKI